MSTKYLGAGQREDPSRDQRVYLQSDLQLSNTLVLRGEILCVDLIWQWCLACLPGRLLPWTLIWLAVYHKIPKNLDTWKIAVIILKFEPKRCRQNSMANSIDPDQGQHCLPSVQKLRISMVISPKDADRMANSADPDQTAPEQSDLGLHCLPRPVYPKTWDHYGRCYPSTVSILESQSSGLTTQSTILWSCQAVALERGRRDRQPTGPPHTCWSRADPCR